MGNVSNSMGQKQEARNSQALGRSRQKGIQKLGGSKYFNDWLKKVFPHLQDAFETERSQKADERALQEQDTLQGSDALAARRGLLGSGAHMMAGQAARGERQSGLSQDMVESYMKAMGLVSGAAGDTQRSLVSAISGSPYPPVSAQGPYGLEQGGNALAIYLASMNRGNQGNQGTPGINSYNPYSYTGVDYRPTY